MDTFKDSTHCQLNFIERNLNLDKILNYRIYPEEISYLIIICRHLPVHEDNKEMQVFFHQEHHKFRKKIGFT